MFTAMTCLTVQPRKDPGVQQQVNESTNDVKSIQKNTSQITINNHKGKKPPKQATWMNLKNMLIKKSQTEEYTLHDFLRNPRKDTTSLQ